MLVKSKELEVASKNLLVDELNGNTEFALLVAEIQKYHKDVEVKRSDALQFEFEAAEGEEGLKVNAIFVSLGDEAIVQAIKEVDGLRLKAHFSAENEKGEKVIRKAIVEDEKVKVEFEVPFAAEYFLFVEELKNPQGGDEEARLTPEAWYEGCLVFFNSGNGKYYYYKYCGAKCTGEGKTGKKFEATPINTLDSCCRSHDRCWANFGKGDNGCDYELYLCANKTYDPGWWMVAEFGLLCSQGKLGSIC